MIADGAAPKVITSAKESNSLPIGELTFSKRAAIPSKKSNTAPIIINSNATSILPAKAKPIAMQPEIRLQQVILLGICFFIFTCYLAST